MTEVHVNRIWFEFIREGKKTIEGRLNKGKFKDMKIGDIISFVNDANKVKVQIICNSDDVLCEITTYCPCVI